jgi:hypothetical protein
MSKVKEEPRPSGRIERKSSMDGPSGKIGWDVAVLVTIGTVLALFGIGLLVIGLLMH